jgi:predicted HTH domain antitoxin
MSEAYMMQESRQLRRAKLAEGIRRHRHLLSALAALKKTPLSVEMRAESRIQEISDELRKMKDELHELNVQQIREESSSG